MILSALPLTLNFNRVDAKDGIAPYFREELRRMLRAQKPVRENYRGWEAQKFIDDSIAWETNPLYGWIEKIPSQTALSMTYIPTVLKFIRPSTPACRNMQRKLWPNTSAAISSRLFFREKRGTKGAPYTTDRAELSEIRRNHLVRNAMKNTDRYRMMVKAGASKDEINRAFHTRER